MSQTVEVVDLGEKFGRFSDYWHPRIAGDHSHMPMMMQMADGKVKGMLLIGQNPATSLNGRLQRKALAKVEWLVVRDLFETESAAFWYNSPEVKSGEIKTEDIKTEVFLLPSTAIGEIDGTVVSTTFGPARGGHWSSAYVATREGKVYEFNRDNLDYDQ